MTTVRWQPEYHGTQYRQYRQHERTLYDHPLIDPAEATRSDCEGIAPPPQHLLATLEQLLEGSPDTTASRRLSVSPRTFSRRVAELLEFLGATTRFQGGVEVARRGWLVVSPPPRITALYRGGLSGRGFPR